MSTLPPAIAPALASIPSNTPSGLLPPYRGSDPAVKPSMSPYVTSMLDVIERYGTSPERITLLQGLLYYRRALLELGLCGFQWLAGSFVEDVEMRAGRSPRDIDVVTFFHRPSPIRNNDAAWAVAVNANLALFRPAQLKRFFLCDAYSVDLDTGNAPTLVDWTRYWFGLFAHARVSTEWKGIVQVSFLNTSDEDNFIAMLKNRGQQ